MDHASFVAAAPRPSRAAPMLSRVFGSGTTDHRKLRLAFAVLVVTAIALVTIPDLITYLTIEHSPIAPPGEASAASALPLARLASLGGSAVLLALSAIVAVMRGHPNRDITGLLVLLVALNLPYVLSPELPSRADVPKIVLANVFFVALWNIGAPIAGLKWVPITVAVIDIYSLVGGLIIPDHMMYNADSEKAFIAGWELAGPFGHANVLGMYSALGFALTPLIATPRWRRLTAVILFVTVVATASRSALIAAVFVLVWWVLCWFRSVISVRFTGTVLVAVCAAATFTFPLLHWNPHAFTDRAHVWAESLNVWRDSPLVGLGVNWFLHQAQASGNIAKWAFVGTGHNIMVDTLVKSGLVGVALLVPLLLAGVHTTRSLRDTSQQIACFGFMIAFFVGATTEALWALLPNLQLFPISGLIFAVLLMSRRDDRTLRAGP